MSELRVTVRRRPAADVSGFGDALHPVLRRVLAARGVATEDAAELKLRHLHDPALLGHVDRAGALLADAITRSRHVIVVGDFDADGATGVAVAVRGLTLLGAKRIGYAVPHRMRHGYGLSPLLVQELLARAPDLLVTVDHGISSHAGIAAARAAGVPVLVTDHHLPGPTLPDAELIVNPNVSGDGFPSKALSGVGVMFYVLLATRAELRRRGWFDAVRAEPELSTLLDLVALGTVADLVPLDRNNRVLVAAGLRRIRQGLACAGISALLEVARRDAGRIGATDLGFAIAPRINAAGRIEDMAVGIECLLTDDRARALVLAQQLDAINAERREVQDDMLEGAEALIGSLTRRIGELPVGLCLLDRAWHAGVVGLVASKLKDRLNRPVIAFAPGSESGEELRGSARSVSGFHVRDALAAIDAAHPGLVLRFGGHAMAAGMSLLPSRFAEFAEAFDREVRRTLGDTVGTPEILSDGELASDELNLDLAEQLAASGPWGQAFPEPVFDGAFEVRRWSVMKGKHLRLELARDSRAPTLKGVYFGGYTGNPVPSRVHLAYQLALDEWNGVRRVQLMVRHLAPLPPS